MGLFQKEASIHVMIMLLGLLYGWNDRIERRVII